MSLRRLTYTEMTFGHLSSRLNNCRELLYGPPKSAPKENATHTKPGVKILVTGQISRAKRDSNPTLFALASYWIAAPITAVYGSIRHIYTTFQKFFLTKLKSFVIYQFYSDFNHSANNFGFILLSTNKIYSIYIDTLIN